MMATTWMPTVTVKQWSGYSQTDLPLALRALADYVQQGRYRIDILSIDFISGSEGWDIRLIEVVPYVPQKAVE